MSGHSKWSTIKHKKAKTDAQKGKAFTKVVKEIVVAVKRGGSDPEANPSLRLALQKAKEVNMPKDNVQRAIAKGAGPGEDDNYEEVTLEAYANDGIGLIIETLTDNKNRTLPNIRTILNKAGGALTTKGAVSFQFDKKGILIFTNEHDEDTIMEIAITANAENVETNPDGSFEITTTPESYEDVKSAFEEKNIFPESASLSLIPQNSIALNEEQAKTILGLIEKLEDDEDVQNVYGNFDISDDIIEKIMG